MDCCGRRRLNRTHCADAASALAGIPTASLDIVVTSPPYWGQRRGGGLGSEPDPRKYIKKTADTLEAALRALKPDGTLWVNLGDAYNTPINWRPGDERHSTLGRDRTGHAPSNAAYRKDRGSRRAFVDPGAGWLQRGNLPALPHRITAALTDRGWFFRGGIIWVKKRPVPEGLCRRPHRRHETVHILAPGAGHRFRRRPPVGSVWTLAQSPNTTGHDAAFPIELPLECIRSCDPRSEAVVCDPFMGGGTTAAAAQSLGLRWLGFDIDPGHCRTANLRTDAASEATV